MTDEHEDVWGQFDKDCNQCDWKLCAVLAYLTIVHPFLAALAAVWIYG